MIVIAILLIALAAAFAVAVALQATEPVTVDMLGMSADTSTREIFFAGVLAAAVFGIGLWLLKASTARARRKRQEIKDLKRGRRTEVERLEAEKAELESALRREQRTTPPAASGGGTASAGTASGADTSGRSSTGAHSVSGGPEGRSGSVDLTAAERARAGLSKDQRN